MRKTSMVFGCPADDYRLGALALQKKKTGCCRRKTVQVYAMGFYNQENLFQYFATMRVENDYEYLPAKGWNGMKYTSKLKKHVACPG